ncbi:hypothetical protein EJ070_31670 [Mesorhizobium sp. M1E.F.Ca.ET.045.02.1.1]|uniref:Swt1 family HEPN domain-containing protein n=1 Tax=Mesorhizobium sp. M1E.F.Ca.ET.045.02.1.1 TaxID=2493672 RepID=UPI000F74C6AE|nr:Swt1 family HEPN domain-containing protein [Mesorhizobium sp. M1E.F.Ca.ET.045.02.1.1]AZO24778.1 hypothetical protein EJ070_31670 [Mesorhizobium sp. M1E.F.Ca.ET.045.02.1.1]
MTKPSKDFRDFVFRGLLLESEADIFRKAGINVGVDVSQSEESLLLEALAPFGVQRRNQALEMSRLYAVLHAFENEVRSLIRDTLVEKVGPTWWDTASVPVAVKKIADSRKKAAEKDSWLEGAKDDQLEFVDFGDLAAVIIQNWDFFKDIMPTQEWIKQRMTELEKARNFVAHNRMLLPSEFQRMYMYISDWNKAVGL